MFFSLCKFEDVRKPVSKIKSFFKVRNDVAYLIYNLFLIGLFQKCHCLSTPCQGDEKNSDTLEKYNKKLIIQLKA